MKISSAVNFCKVKTNSINRKFQQINFRNNLQKDIVSFGNSSWDDFTGQIYNAYGDENLSRVLLTSILSSKNRLGEGAKKIVYSIDGIDDYVVAHMKEEDFNPKVPCVSCVDKFPGHNLGQPIGRNYHGFLVMKKISGKNHGIPNWSSAYVGFNQNGAKITTEEAKIFLSQLRALNNMPFESYIDLAKQIRYLTDKRIKIDMINPNNLMVDEAGGKMTYFDLFEKPEVFYSILPEVNSALDMAYLLVDPLLHNEYLNALNSKEQQEAIELTKSIIKKSKSASKDVGLLDDEHIVSATYALLQGRLAIKLQQNMMYLENYNNFRNIYKNSIQETV